MNHYQGGQHGPKYGDTTFILEQVDKLPINMQSRVKARYSEIYAELEGDDKQRYRANSWLRSVVKKYGLVVDKNDIMF